MTKSILELKSKKGSDNFQTPAWPVESLLKVIGDKLIESIILDPCCGKGHLVDTLIKNNYAAFGHDKDTGKDFLKMPLYEPYDAIITNPPYSLKDDFLNMCYTLEVPFALLLPLSALEGQKRLEMYKKHGIQVCLLPKRVNFVPPTEGKKSSAWFATAWFTHGFNLPDDITYLGE